MVGSRFRSCIKMVCGSTGREEEKSMSAAGAVAVALLLYLFMICYAGSARSGTSRGPANHGRPVAAAAVAVLLDPSLLRLITLFQSGIPEDIARMVRAIPTTNPDENRGLLARQAMKAQDLRLLKRLHRVQFDKPRLRIKYTCICFYSLWHVVLRTSSVAVADWFSDQSDLMRGRMVGDITAALWNQGHRMEMVVWLLTKFPAYKSLVLDCHMERVAIWGDVALMQWLEANVPNLPVSRKALEIAARHGKLEMVIYLHEHHSEGCASTALASAAADGHLEVVKFLHENRREELLEKISLVFVVRSGQTSVIEYLHENGLADGYEDAMVHAARQGYLGILQCLLHLRPECCTTSVLRCAASRGRLKVVQYLHEHYHHLCTSDVILDAIRVQWVPKLPLVKYLSEHCDQVNGSALIRAAIRGDMEMVEWLVTTRTDGCLVRAKAIATEYEQMEVVQYLQGIIHPRLDESRHDEDKCHTGKYRTCQRQPKQGIRIRMCLILLRVLGLKPFFGVKMVETMEVDELHDAAQVHRDSHGGTTVMSIDKVTLLQASVDKMALSMFDALRLLPTTLGDSNTNDENVAAIKQLAQQVLASVKETDALIDELPGLERTEAQQLEELRLLQVQSEEEAQTLRQVAEEAERWMERARDSLRVISETRLRR